MLAKTMSTALIGINGVPVTVEVDISPGLPSYDIVGLPGPAVKEARERVFRAIRNSGFELVPARTLINLAPADVRKEAAIYDLPIAMGILRAAGLITADISGMAFLGELSLDGNLRSINGTLPMLLEMRQKGYTRAAIPEPNAKEACVVSGMEVYAVKSLTQLVEHINGQTSLEPLKTADWDSLLSNARYSVDFAAIKGQDSAKRAAQVAAAGSHNVLFIGPPGSGKSMLAKALAGILPKLTFEEALEITKIYSVAGAMSGYEEGIVTTRPFRSPHHTASYVSLVGGGNKSRPGEISLAHNGILFLDELPEFTRNTIEALRQPMEDGRISVTRVMQQAEYPASCMVVAAMNPCPCGNYGSTTQLCTCSSAKLQRYVGKISGPFLDRMDLHIEMNAIEYDQYISDEEDEDTETVRERVKQAVDIQKARYVNEPFMHNSALDGENIKKYCRLSDRCSQLLGRASNTYGFSARTISRIIKVARTIADLDGRKDIEAAHIAEAIQYRIIDRKYWGYGYGTKVQ